MGDLAEISALGRELATPILRPANGWRQRPTDAVIDEPGLFG
jgi:hypothetical protein